MPLRWADDQQLGTWVHAQRASKKKMDRGEPSNGMAVARVLKLEAIGFAWELSAAAISEQRSEGNRDDAGWEVRLAKLKAYKRRHSNCNVPLRWPEDPGLGSWVVDQRKYKRKLDRGELSPRITEARAAKLTELGFNWNPGTHRQLSGYVGSILAKRTKRKVEEEADASKKAKRVKAHSTHSLHPFATGISRYVTLYLILT